MELLSINRSEQKGTIKTPVPAARIALDGLEGDAHAGPWHRQISLLGTPSIGRLAVELGRAIDPGEFGENLTVRGLEASSVGLLDLIETGTAVLEVTQIGKECHGDGCAIFQAAGRCVMPVEGIFARVRTPGDVRAGDPVAHRPRALGVLAITLSDRASAGLYEDRSGPLLRARLEALLRRQRFHPRIDAILIPDDPERLEEAIRTARDGGADLVFTTGGTGIGPRDFTPEVVSRLCERMIPGVMELARIRSAERHPAAVLSRSVAGLSGRCLVFALPGSPRAVEEYVDVIEPLLAHLILTVHGVGH